MVTRQDLPSRPGITFYQGEAVELVLSLKAQAGKDIYCDGGAHLIKSLMQERLVDTFTLFVMPVFLGSGTRLFPGGIPETDVTLLSTHAYGNGAVRLVYQLKDGSSA